MDPRDVIFLYILKIFFLHFSFFFPIAEYSFIFSFIRTHWQKLQEQNIVQCRTNCKKGRIIHSITYREKALGEKKMIALSTEKENWKESDHDWDYFHDQSHILALDEVDLLVRSPPDD